MRDAASITTAADAIPWYHTIELPDGVTTKGWVDCRPIRDRVLLPERLDGMRVLDVGTWDGFWAFEMERRGADVTTVDVPDPEQWDWPPRLRMGKREAGRRSDLDSTSLGEGFRLARELLSSSVSQELINVYELGPERLGKFDLVFVGSILLHLRDPVAALAAVRSVASGPVVLTEAIEVLPTILHPRTPQARLEGDVEVRWWQPNLAAVEHMAGSAGLTVRRRTRPFFIPLGAGHPMPGLRQRALSLLSAVGREHLIAWQVGIAHLSLLTESS